MLKTKKKRLKQKNVFCIKLKIHVFFSTLASVLKTRNGKHLFGTRI